MKSWITIKSSVFILLLVIVIGCETEKILFKGPYFVQFTDTSITKKESFPDVIKIEVHLSGPVLSEDLTINYAISGTAREGTDYTITSDENKLTIKKGEYVGYIQVKLIDNANNILRSQDVTFTLLSVSKSGIEVGQGPSAIGKSFTLTIQDDCILAGVYSGIQPQNILTQSPVDGITVTSSDCENYTLSNWNLNIDIINQISAPYDLPLTFVDNGDNTLSVPDQEISALPDDYATIRGKGIVDPVTFNIQLDLVLVDLDSTEVSLKFTRN